MYKQNYSSQVTTVHVDGTYTTFKVVRLLYWSHYMTCLFYRAVSWSCCGLQISWVIGDRGSHITRHFISRHFRLVSKLHYSQQNTRNKWHEKRHDTEVLSSRNGCLQKASHPNCLCADLQWKTNEEKKRLSWGAFLIAMPAEVLLEVLRLLPWYFPRPVSYTLIGFRSSLLSFPVKTNFTLQNSDS